jgi:hypothetical protein
VGEMVERAKGGLNRGLACGWWPEFARTWVRTWARPWWARGPRRLEEGERADLGRIGVFLFPRISNCFSISFSLGAIQIQTKIQIQTNSYMCNNSKNI